MLPGSADANLKAQACKSAVEPQDAARQCPIDHHSKRLSALICCSPGMQAGSSIQLGNHLQQCCWSTVPGAQHQQQEPNLADIVVAWPVCIMNLNRRVLKKDVHEFLCANGCHINPQHIRSACFAFSCEVLSSRLTACHGHSLVHCLHLRGHGCSGARFAIQDHPAEAAPCCMARVGREHKVQQRLCASQDKRDEAFLIDERLPTASCMDVVWPTGDGMQEDVESKLQPL